MIAIVRQIFIWCSLLLLPFTATAQFSFITNNGAITITGYDGAYSNVIIPDSINGYPVTAIQYDAFYPLGVPGPASVVIPDSVTNIGEGAFVGCENLTNVLLSTNVTTLPQGLFQDSGLTSFVFPSGITVIPGGIFDGCYHLHNVLIPDSVQIIGDYAFNNCASMTTVTIPDSVTSLGDWAFAGCLNITNLTIGHGITSIPANEFSTCTALTTVSIPDSVTNIGSTYYVAAFSLCYSLTNITYGSGIGIDCADLRYSGTPLLASITVTSNNPVLSSLDGVLFDKMQTTLIQCPIAKAGSYTIPNTVTSIWGQAFLNCRGLTDISFSGCITVNGGSIFSGCEGITNINILAGMTNILPSLFYPCDNLESINVSSLNPQYSSLQGVLFDKARTTLLEYPYNGLSNYTVPDGVKSIADEAFYCCGGLTAITLPAGLTYLGYDAFGYCYQLTSLAIPEGVTCISDYTFEYCTNLITVSIPIGVTNIGNCVFTFCRSLNSLHFRGNVPSAGPFSFVYIPWDPFRWIPPFTIYYLPDTAGWSNTLAGATTALWLPTVQYDSSLGFTSNWFGFNINWASGQTIVVDASTNLSNPVWLPSQTNIFTTDSIYFKDAMWPEFPSRFYRIRSP